MKFIKLGIGLVMIFSLFGCTHNLRITNLDQYENWNYNQFNKKTTIGIIPTVKEITNKKLVKSLTEHLALLNAVAILPYHLQSSIPVDYIMKVDTDSTYKGSGWNYLIDFPGFLIWAPAWHGYNFTINHNIKVILIDGTTKQEIKRFEIPLEFKIRQADIGRTWVECGWLEVGATAFIGGFFHIQYDSDVTKMVADEIYEPIGKYLAEEIKDHINACALASLNQKVTN